MNVSDVRTDVVLNASDYATDPDMTGLSGYLSTLLSMLVQIDAKIDILSTRVERIEQTHSHIADVVDDLRPEVSSIVEGLQSNPMVRMMLGKKTTERNVIRSVENFS